VEVRCEDHESVLDFEILLSDLQIRPQLLVQPKQTRVSPLDSLEALCARYGSVRREPGTGLVAIHGGSSTGCPIALSCHDTRNYRLYFARSAPATSRIDLEEIAMESFAEKLAVITGGGTGMGRELAIQLAKEGCRVAMCDVSEEAMDQTRALCQKVAPSDTRISCFVADVSNEDQVLAFRDSVLAEHETDCINLLFNNAGIGGAGSFICDPRDEWEKTFAVCWEGVYFCSRAFVPLLIASPEGHLVNTSSVNGFWASVGPSTAHTSYSAAKFAVKGFTEALVNDFRLNAPHVGVSLVMPGHIGTSIVINSGKILGHDPKEMSAEEIDEARERLAKLGLDTTGATDDEVRQGLQQLAESFRDDAPMTAAEAANVILDGVRNGNWRILVGQDAAVLDRLVREDPEGAYEPAFMERLRAETGWNLGL